MRLGLCQPLRQQHLQGHHSCRATADSVLTQCWVTQCWVTSLWHTPCSWSMQDEQSCPWYRYWRLWAEACWPERSHMWSVTGTRL